MCLGVPGKILSLEPNPVGMTMGKVSFGGVAKEICLAYVPEAQVGDYVIVHAGFALNTLDEAEAMEVFALLKEMGELEDVTSDELAPA
jgi:hydrogenase expression/formation protein HypC